MASIRNRQNSVYFWRMDYLGSSLNLLGILVYTLDEKPKIPVITRNYVDT